LWHNAGNLKPFLNSGKVSMILKNFQDNYFFQCSPFDYFGRGKCERQFPPRGSNLPHTQHSIPRHTIPHLRAQGPKGWMCSNGRSGRMLHYRRPMPKQLAFKFWSDFFHAFTIFRGIRNKKSFLCLLFTIYAYFCGPKQYSPIICGTDGKFFWPSTICLYGRCWPYRWRWGTNTSVKCHNV